MNTFKVDNVKVEKTLDKFYSTIDHKNNLNDLIGFGVEASSLSKNGITLPSNNLMAAINTAYSNHIPLTLSPDIIWLAIAQGLSLHINNNAEELRHQFVNHEGKEKIEIFENSFQKGSSNNDWSHTFGAFSNAIKDYIGKKRDLIVSNFSMTGLVEKAASEITLMESMQQYFKYECATLCGIPEITLLGTTEDWKAIKGRVQVLSEFKMSWWTDKLIPIIDEFIAASANSVNKPFWQSMFKQENESGGPYITGWSIYFFPYLKNWQDDNRFSLKNEFAAFRRYDGLTTSQMPIGLAKVPFVWNYYSSKFNMELAAGFTSFSFQDGQIKPEIGWAVRDTEIMSRIKCSSTELVKGDWDERKKRRMAFIDRLKPLSFEHIEDYDDELIIGVIPTNKLEEAKKIDGLTITIW